MIKYILLWAFVCLIATIVTIWRIHKRDIYGEGGPLLLIFAISVVIVLATYLNPIFLGDPFNPLHYYGSKKYEDFEIVFEKPCVVEIIENGETKRKLVERTIEINDDPYVECITTKTFFTTQDHYILYQKQSVEYKDATKQIESELKN